MLWFYIIILASSVTADTCPNDSCPDNQYTAIQKFTSSGVNLICRTIPENMECCGTYLIPTYSADPNITNYSQATKLCEKKEKTCSDGCPPGQYLTRGIPIVVSPGRSVLFSLICEDISFNKYCCGKELILIEADFIKDINRYASVTRLCDITNNNYCPVYYNF